MAEIFKTKEIFVEACFYDGSEDCAIKVSEFINASYSNYNSGNLIITYADGDFVILEPDSYIFKAEKSIMVLLRAEFNKLFFKPKMDHN